MTSQMTFTQFLWRATAAFLRRSGERLTRYSSNAYGRSLPKLRREDRQLLRLNEKLRNRHEGMRCFVIGNGRSIRFQDLSHLANEITFVMNAFWKHEIVRVWQPTYYVLSDPILFDRSDSVKEFFADLKARVQRTTFIVPLRQKTTIETDDLLPVASTHFVAFTGEFAGSLTEHTIDLAGMVPGIETVAQLALMAAIYMGCSPIYLIGLDHNWLADRETADYNFYQGKTLQNHPLVTGRSMFPYDVDMEAMLKVWKLYRKLKVFAEQQGIEIFNATEGSYLDVFERVSYQSLFSHKPEASARLS